MAPPIVSHDPYAALRVRDFRWFIASLFTQTLGTQIQGVVVGWQVYAQTRSPLSLGLLGLAEALPFIAIALYAGHVADRVNRRQVALVATLVLFACSVALLGLTFGGRISEGRVWPVYLVIFVSGIARSFLQPSRTALAAQVVPRHLYLSAVGWRSSTWQIGAVAGPAIGGLLYGFSGAVVAYGVDASLMACAGFSLARIARSEQVVPSAAESIVESLTSGVRFVWSQPIFLGAITLDLFAVLFGGAEALLPVFAAEILRVGPQGLGMLRAAPAVGASLMSLYLSHRAPLQRAGRVLFGSVAAFGVCMIGFALSRSFGLSLLLLSVSGMADNISVVLRSSLLQTLTPVHLLGRVSSVNAIFIGSSNEIGAFESGVAASLIGTVPSVIFGGVMTLAVVLVTAWRVPQLRRLERIE
jgi:MFS family permease